MKQNALVTKINSNGSATVSVLRKSACSTCSGRHVCGGSKQTLATVKNPLGAKAGDTVVIEVPSSNVLLYATLVFLAPVLLALIAYASFSPLGTTATVIATACGFCLPFAVAFIASKVLGDRLSPCITEILPEGFDSTGDCCDGEF